MISPIQNNFVISNTPNINSIAHNQEMRTDVNYQNVQHIIDDKQETKDNTVVSKDNSDSADTRHDAKDEGKNKYYNLRNQKKKKVPDEGVVKAKTQGGFDFKI